MAKKNSLSFIALILAVHLALLLPLAGQNAAAGEKKTGMKSSTSASPTWTTAWTSWKRRSTTFSGTRRSATWP